MSEKKTASRMMEALRFVITGGVCFVIEFIALVLLRDTLLVGVMGVANRTATMIATPIAFLISVVVNYLMCLMWVFKGTKNAGVAAKIGFLITSLIGLLLNSVLMALLGALLGEDTVLLTLMGKSLTMYMVNKMIATLLVMVWNYFTKRAVLQSEAVAKLTDKLTRR